MIDLYIRIVLSCNISFICLPLQQAHSPPKLVNRMNKDIESGNMPFIMNESYGEWFGKLPHLTLFHCQFNKNSYEDVLFQQYNIRHPDTLQNAVKKRKAEFLAGRYCANKVLEAHAIHNFVVNTGEHRSPQWPDNIYGTISHTNDHAVAVACRKVHYAGIGIDIEELISTETLENIHSQIIYRDELFLIRNSSSEKNFLFTLIFSIKESFFKAAYPLVKKYFSFDAITVLNIDLQTGEILFRINDKLHPSLATGKICTGYFQKIDSRRIVTLSLL